MKEKEHLPLFGVEPIYVYSIAILTLLAFISRNLSVFEAGKLTSLKSLLIILGSILEDYCNRVNRCIPWKQS